MAPAAYIVLGLLGAAVASLPVIFAIDVVKRPVATWPWLIPPAIAPLALEPVLGLELGFAPQRTVLLLLGAGGQAVLVSLFAALATVALGISRWLRPDAEVHGELRLGLLVVTVLATVGITPLLLLFAPQGLMVAPVGFAAVCFVFLDSVQGGDRLAAGRRTGAALLILAALGAVAPQLLMFTQILVGWPQEALVAAMVVGGFAACIAVPIAVGLLVLRLGIRPTPLVGLVVLLPVLSMTIRVGTAAYAIAFLLPGDLPVVQTGIYHPHLSAGFSGAVLEWGGWRRIRGGAAELPASTSACRLGRVVPVQRGMYNYIFDTNGGGWLVLRDEAGWWLDGDGPFDHSTLLETLRDGSQQRLAVVRSPQATFQQVIDLCTVRSDLVCELDPDLSRCGE